MKDAKGEQLTRGTKIILSLKEEMGEYVQPTKIKDLIKRYS